MQPPWEPPEQPLFAVIFGISANNGAERTPRELRGSMLRPFLGPRSSSSEGLPHWHVRQVKLRELAIGSQVWQICLVCCDWP
eukprot:6055568-Alexandrium_andersonii.AAC.1